MALRPAAQVAASGEVAVLKHHALAWIDSTPVSSYLAKRCSEVRTCSGRTPASGSSTPMMPLTIDSCACLRLAELPAHAVLSRCPQLGHEHRRTLQGTRRSVNASLPAASLSVAQRRHGERRLVKHGSASLLAVLQRVAAGHPHGEEGRADAAGVGPGVGGGQLHQQLEVSRQ